MFKEILVLHASSLRSRRACQDYMIHRHGPIALSSPTLKAIFRHYAFQEVLSAGGTPDPQSLYRRESEPMLLVEHVWSSVDDFACALVDPEYLATVRPDEEYLGREIIGRIPTAYHLEESVVFSAAEHGVHKVFDFLKKRADVSQADFARSLDQTAVSLREDRAFRAVARARTHNLVQKTESLYVASGTDYDAVVETWVTDYAALSALNAQIRATHAPFVDAGASFSVFTREERLFSR